VSGILTSLFYYDLYRPYIVKEIWKEDSISRPKITFERFLTNATETRPSDEDRTIRLNKAFKREVSDYATNLAHSVIGFKDAVKYATYATERFALSRREYDLEHLSGDLLAFTESYNHGLRFALTQNHSPLLRATADEQDSVLRNRTELLANFGLNFSNETNEIRFDTEHYQAQSQNGKLTHSMMATLRNTFENVYNLSAEIMQLPLSAHMEFNELRFYYNYQPYLSTADTFGIIESGMIVNVTL